MGRTVGDIVANDTGNLFGADMAHLLSSMF